MELTGYTEDEVESLVTALSEALHNDLNEPDEIPENCFEPMDPVTFPDSWKPPEQYGGSVSRISGCAPSSSSSRSCSGRNEGGPGGLPELHNRGRRIRRSGS